MFVALARALINVAQALEFIMLQKGPSDALLACDGRSRQCRKAIEDGMATARHLSEVWVVFTPTPRLGRKVAWASDNKEALLVSLPVPRTLLHTKDRESFKASGEASTHDASYTGVGPAPWASLPFVNGTDKRKIHGFEPNDPKPGVFDTSAGQPLFWAERKPIALWRSILQDLDIKAIFDVSPGSGTLARAALELGLSYVGLTRQQEHVAFLNNVVDRHALTLICKSGSPLFQQDLQKCVEEHFNDILDQLKEAAESKDTAPEGGDIS